MKPSQLLVSQPHLSTFLRTAACTVYVSEYIRTFMNRLVSERRCNILGEGRAADSKIQRTYSYDMFIVFSPRGLVSQNRLRVITTLFAHRITLDLYTIFSILLLST